MISPKDPRDSFGGSLWERDALGMALEGPFGAGWGGVLWTLGMGLTITEAWEAHAPISWLCKGGLYCIIPPLCRKMVRPFSTAMFFNSSSIMVAASPQCWS